MLLSTVMNKTDSSTALAVQYYSLLCKEELKAQRCGVHPSGTIAGMMAPSWCVKLVMTGTLQKLSFVVVEQQLRNNSELLFLSGSLGSGG